MRNQDQKVTFGMAMQSMFRAFITAMGTVETSVKAVDEVAGTVHKIAATGHLQAGAYHDERALEIAHENEMRIAEIRAEQAKMKEATTEA